MVTRTFVVAAAMALALSGCGEDPDTTSPEVSPEADDAAGGQAEPASEAEGPQAPAPAAPEPQAPEPQIPAPAAPGPGGGAGASEIPDEIVIERGGFVPEGVEYDQNNERFLVGSLAEGTVFEIDNDGSMTPVVTDDALVSSVGIEVDEERDRLLVANSDRSVFEGDAQGQAMLGIYELGSGERVAMVDLTEALDDVGNDAAFFANDVAVGAEGDAYVTDTQMHVVYRVGMDGGEASLLHEFDGMPGPNGIVYHDDGYLLVVGGGSLYRIPVDDPSSASEVMLPEPLEGGDGMVWTQDGRLAVVSNSQSRVIALTSDDGWMSAELAGTAPFEGQGTTAAVVGDELYVVRPHFADQDPPSIVRVTFE